MNFFYKLNMNLDNIITLYRSRNIKTRSMAFLIDCCKGKIMIE